MVEILFFIDLEKVLSNYEIFLLGNWRSQEYYDLFTRSIPKDTKIRVKTNISEEEKRLLISESMFLVRFGNMGFGPAIAVIEAISCGTPVIINNDLGSAELIKKYDAGYVPDTSDPKIVAKIISESTDLKYSQLLEKVSSLRKSWTWKEHVGKLL